MTDAEVRKGLSAITSQMDIEQVQAELRLKHPRWRHNHVVAVYALLLALESEDEIDLTALAARARISLDAMRRVRLEILSLVGEASA